MRARKLSAPTGRPVHVIEPARHARAYRPDKGYSVTDPLVSQKRLAGSAGGPPKWRQCKACLTWFQPDQPQRVHCSRECSQARLKRSQRGKP